MSFWAGVDVRVDCEGCQEGVCGRLFWGSL